MQGVYILSNISSVSGIHPILNSSAADLQQTLLKILNPLMSNFLVNFSCTSVLNICLCFCIHQIGNSSFM